MEGEEKGEGKVPQGIRTIAEPTVPPKILCGVRAYEAFQCSKGDYRFVCEMDETFGGTVGSAELVLSPANIEIWPCACRNNYLVFHKISMLSKASMLLSIEISCPSRLVASPWLFEEFRSTSERFAGADWWQSISLLCHVAAVFVLSFLSLSNLLVLHSTLTIYT